MFMKKQFIAVVVAGIIAFASAGDVHATLYNNYKCSYNAGAGDVLVQFGKKIHPMGTNRLLSNWSLADAVETVNVNVPKGKYDIYLDAYDGYAGRRFTPGQPREQYHLAVGNSSHRTRSTGDLRDGVEEARWTGKVNSNYVVNWTVHKVTAVHSAYPDKRSPNSLVPVCALFKRIYTPVNGVCNSALNGKQLSSKPTKNLCTRGTASSVRGSGTNASPWRWSCAGAHGGATAQCSATKKPDPIVCGNGKVERGEQCDDGNTKNHDGCSAQCRTETPKISIDKNDADNGDDTQTVDKGSNAKFTITVKNTGDVDLKNVVVTDPRASHCNKAIGNLAVGAQKSYTCTATNVTQDFTNTARVVGTPINGGSHVSDSDPTDIKVLIPGTPDISIIKDDADNGDDTQTIDKGDKPKFTITVKNIGDVDLKDVTVSDTKEPNCNKTIGDLAVGEQKSYTCTGTSRDDAYVNVAHVVGTPTDGQDPVKDDDDTTIVIRTPQGPICGNGIKEATEQCDDGNVENGDGCSAQCTTEATGPSCGNGKVEAGEECDGGNQCTASCTLKREPKDEPKKKCKASIGDLVWNDRNKNGEQDPGEEGISGIRVKLIQGDSVDYETTDSDGNYTFKNLCAHKYKVVVAAETLPEGCYQTYDKNGPLDHKSTHYLDRKDKVRDADFGYYCPTRVVQRTSPVTGPGAGAAGIATMLASGAAYLSYRRTRKDALASTIIDTK